MTHLAHRHVDIALLVTLVHTCITNYHKVQCVCVCVCVCVHVGVRNFKCKHYLQLPRRFVKGYEWRTYSHGVCIHEGMYVLVILRNVEHNNVVVLLPLEFISHKDILQEIFKVDHRTNGHGLQGLQSNSSCMWSPTVSVANIFIFQLYT